MRSIDILARFDEDGDDKRCASRECLTALEAVMQELEERPADTADALEIGAMDENMNVSAFRIDEGWEVHIYVGSNDTWFVAESD